MSMKYKKFLNLAALTFIISANAAPSYGARISSPSTPLNSSTPLNYSYAGIKYVSQDIDHYDCDPNGLKVYGSLDIDNGLYALSSITDLSGTCGANTITAGAGYHLTFSPNIDLYGSLSAERISPDHGDNDTGLVAAIGVRGAITHNIEARAELAHHTAYDDTTSLNVEADYWFMPQFAATLNTRFADDESSLAIGARMRF